MLVLGSAGLPCLRDRATCRFLAGVPLWDTLPLSIDALSPTLPQANVANTPRKQLFVIAIYFALIYYPRGIR